MGISGDTKCLGLLDEEFDRTAKAYVALKTRLLNLQRTYEWNRDHAACSEAEKMFWSRLAARVELWRDPRKQDDLRLQFRLCEMSKIAGIVCRNAGRKRGVPAAQAAEADLMEQDEPSVGVDAGDESESGGAKARAQKTLGELKVFLDEEEVRMEGAPVAGEPPAKRARR